MENLPEKISYSLVEIKDRILESARHGVGDEVQIYSEHALNIIGDFTIPYDCAIGKIQKLDVSKDLEIIYTVEIYDKLRVEPTGQVAEIPEAYLQKSNFLFLKLHNFNSRMEAEKFRYRNKVSGSEDGQKISASDLVKMQMRFYKYGATGEFPKEWEELMKNFKSSNFLDNVGNGNF